MVDEKTVYELSYCGICKLYRRPIKVYEIKHYGKMLTLFRKICDNCFVRKRRNNNGR